tara:strand:+ start:340 stop:501 length:162 start_codon:yes stop_codon:yes gene_type:complete
MKTVTAIIASLTIYVSSRLATEVFDYTPLQIILFMALIIGGVSLLTIQILSEE